MSPRRSRGGTPPESKTDCMLKRSPGNPQASTDPRDHRQSTLILASGVELHPDFPELHPQDHPDLGELWGDFGGASIVAAISCLCFKDA